jgi:osmotically inducible protein OsmC
MPMAAVRTAEVSWSGDLASGNGMILYVSSGAIARLPVSWAARTEAHGGKTSPEELLAAAHASCFSMALSARLGKNGTPPENLAVTARVTFDNPDGAGWKIATSELSVRGRVPGIDEAKFRELAEDARDNCPVSVALRGNVDLSVDAQLESA